MKTLFISISFLALSLCLSCTPEATTEDVMNQPAQGIYFTGDDYSLSPDNEKDG